MNFNFRAYLGFADLNDIVARFYLGDVPSGDPMAAGEEGSKWYAVNAAVPTAEQADQIRWSSLSDPKINQRENLVVYQLFVELTKVPRLGQAFVHRNTASGETATVEILAP